MAIKRTCIGCGFKYDFVAGTVFVCPYCGTEQNPGISPDTMDLLISANNLRRNKQFDKALLEYDRVLKDSPEIGEAHFGRFLCDYEVAEEEELLRDDGNVKFTNSSKYSINENENYQNAIAFSGRSREKWEEIGNTIERLRRINYSLKKTIKSNAYRAAIICDRACARDVDTANEIFDAIRDRVDLFYPEYTLRSVPASIQDTATFVALDNVALLFMVCSRSTKNSQYLIDCYNKFFETHEAYAVNILGDEEDIPRGTEYNDAFDTEDTDELAGEVLRQIRVMGGFSMEEASALRRGESVAKDPSNPSPALDI